MSPPIDPLQLWRKAITSLEGSGNALANKAMGTGDFAAALHQMANLSLGMQQTFEKVLGVYFKKLDLPSRKDVAELAEKLQRIEERLDLHVGARGGAAAAAPPPARTRKAAGTVVPAKQKTVIPAKAGIQSSRYSGSPKALDPRLRGDDDGVVNGRLRGDDGSKVPTLRGDGGSGGKRASAKRTATKSASAKQTAAKRVPAKRTAAKP
ncbi:MAG: hypothetical protein ABWZ88_01705 [Variovorax sp.]